MRNHLALTLSLALTYSISFTASKNIGLSLDYNENNSFVYVNGAKIYQFEAKDIHIDSKAVYNNKFLKIKIISVKYSTDFREKDAPELGLNFICISII